MKVVDTLEKFQEGMLNTDSSAAKDFVLFKRELYQMYEVTNRSVWEHELYSFNIERENLKWLTKANNDFVNEMVKINTADQVSDMAHLKGKVF